MATPSFHNFEWLHLQPAWFKPQSGTEFELDFKTAIRSARYERWQPLWKLLNVKPRFSDTEVGALIGLREEYEGGFGRRG